LVARFEYSSLLLMLSVVEWNSCPSAEQYQ
jgi:hypothetical protein